ncbi:hypothetical protein FRC18_007649 [Serendipita sp. 400]|nr:hypothetical protein FRC18_007649 [Serendipita sp. 400]
MQTTNNIRASNYTAARQPPNPPYGSRNLDGNHLPRPAENSDEDEDSKITPKAYTSHVPLGVVRYQPTPMDPARNANLLTNLLPAKTPRKVVRPKATPREQRMATNSPLVSLSPASVTVAGSPGVEDTAASAFLQHLPGGSSTTSSLAPSVKFSSTSSHHSGTHSSRDIRVLNPSTNIQCSVDFSPTENTDLVFVASDRDVEFYVESSIVFSVSPILAKLIAPIREVNNVRTQTYLEDDDDEPLGVFSLPETYDILDAILRFIHPKVRQPRVRSLIHLKDLLVACKKYKISGGLHNLSVIIAQFAMMTASGTMDGSPLDCYALACQFNFPNIAKLVSKQCLLVDPLKADLGTIFANVAARDIRRLCEMHHARGLAAVSLIEPAVDAREFWCDGCSGVASWFEIWRETAYLEVKSKPVTNSVFSPSFIAGCLKQAMRKCPTRCVEHYLSPKAQLRFAILQQSIDRLKDSI